MLEMDADVIIIGGGAGGGTLARALAPSGLSILILERGEYLPREPANWDAETVFASHRYHTDEQWLDGAGKKFTPVTGYHVGGNTKFYGAAILRRRQEDFSARRHVDGETPAWPIGYDDLAPYYAQAEAWYFAHGEAGADPGEPPRAAYPYPPMTHEPRIQGISDALRAQGLHPFPLPLALQRDEAHPARAPCIRCNTCDGFPCRLHAKGDAEVCGVAPALAYPHVRLLTGTRVTRLIAGPGRRVEALEAEGPDGAHRFQARAFVLAAGAVNSAALLLRSADDAHTNGLANASGQVGRHYMCHLNSACIAIDPRHDNPTVFQKTIAINDFYAHSGDAAFPYPLGHIQNLGKVTPEILRAERPYIPRPLCRWVARHSVDWWLTTEDLPDPDNRVSLTPDRSIRLNYRPNNEAAHRKLCARWKAVLHRLGFPLVFFQRMDISAVAHQVGTLRFGVDPAQSVLNPECRSHELDNLYVADASFMPSISAVNPSLTIMANALRVADILRRQLTEAA
ncbi:MAG: FAD-dependent oxidoreductase [Sulfuricaulis sp.]